jgi:hypothetical protein
MSDDDGDAAMGLLNLEIGEIPPAAGAAIELLLASGAAPENPAPAGDALAAAAPANDAQELQGVEQGVSDGEWMAMASDMAQTRSTPQEVWARHQPTEAYEHEHFFAGAFHGA